MNEPEELESRAKSLGMDIGRLREVLKAGFTEPSYDLMPKSNLKDSPNRNLHNPKGGYWYVKYTQDGIRKSMQLSRDIEEARKMRDEFFASINYGKK